MLSVVSIPTAVCQDDRERVVANQKLSVCAARELPENESHPVSAIFSDKWIAVARFTVLVFLKSVTNRNPTGRKKHGARRSAAYRAARAERSSS